MLPKMVEKMKDNDDTLLSFPPIYLNPRTKKKKVENQEDNPWCFHTKKDNIRKIYYPNTTIFGDISRGSYQLY